MSILVLQIAPRARLATRPLAGTDVEALRTTPEFPYVLTKDGRAIESQGRCAAALLPRADSVVAVLAEADVGWHRITLPKAPAARLREALVGVLEEALLEDAGAVHLAVAPQPVAGQATWVAAVDRRWLTAELKALERAQVFVDRVAPSAWPDDPPIGHFALSSPDAASEATDLTLTWAHADGVANLRLKGNLARALLPDPLPPTARWTATPAAAAAAERWVGSAVTVMTPAERLMVADRSLWNLRQFDLARSTRGSRAVQDSLRRFMSPEWRTVRYGLVALAVTQVLGLNLWAWHQRDAVEAKRRSLDAVLRATYPQVRAILDAPVQMRRETETLRTAAGKPGDNDLEPLLQAASLAWPADRPPVESLRFEPGRLTLAANGWTEQQVEAFRIRVQPAGWRVESADGRLTLSRMPLAQASMSNGATP